MVHGLPRWLRGKESSCQEDLGSIPGLGRSPGEGNGIPLQYAWRIPWTKEPGGLQSWGHKESDTTEVTNIFSFKII